MDPGSKASRKRYAASLESGDFVPPQELRGDAVSANGKCKWDKKKAFINLYKHGVSFEEASLVFGGKHLPGYEVLYDDPTDDGSGLEGFWGVDIRDKMVARLGGSGCVIIKVDREHVRSNRVRLISVQKVSEKDVMRAIQAHEINSSVSVTLRVEAATVGRYLRPSSVVQAKVEQIVQAYENIRYLSSVM
jgi:uncharacterized DUF497 family protein